MAEWLGRGLQILVHQFKSGSRLHFFCPRFRGQFFCAKNQRFCYTLRMQTPPKQIIFDWNGTLLNDRHVSLAVINSLLSQHELPEISLMYYLDEFGFPVKHFYEKLGFSTTPAGWQQLAADFNRLYYASPNLKLHPHALETLQLCKKLNITVALLSATEHQLLVAIVQKLELTSYFHTLQGIDNNEGGSKLQQGHQLIKTLPYPPADTLLVGDTLHDYEVAETLNIPCTLISHGHQSQKQLSVADCPTLPSLQALNRLLSS